MTNALFSNILFLDLKREGTTVGARTIEDRIAMIDAKIEKKQGEIAALEAQKYKLQHPVSMRAVMAKAKESGMTAEQIAEKLGIEL